MYKVLIVDDEVLVRVGLKTTINWESIGFTVVAEASNGEQAYEMYKKHLPDVVITDIKMPKKDGLWLVEELKRENPDVRILVLTCYDEFSFARKALKSGADDYILKSEVEDEELIGIMKKIKSKIDERNKTKHIESKDIMNINDIKRAVFNDLIRANFNMEAKLEERCENIGFPISDTKYAFACVSINEVPGELQTDNSTQKQTNHAVLNIIFDMLGERTIEFIYSRQTKKYYFCIASKDLSPMELKRLFAAASSSVKQYFDIILNVVFTEVFEDLKDAPAVYKDFTNKSQILFYKEEKTALITCTNTIKLSEANVFSLKKQYNKRFIEAIGQEDVERAKGLIFEITRYFEHDRVNPKIVKIFISNIMGELYNSYGAFFEENGKVNSYEYYHYQTENSEHLQDIVNMFTEFTQRVIEEIHYTRYNNPKAMINQAISFIQNHYDEKISLEDVAQRLNLSKHYLCSAFKRVTGENMSLYINKLRIEKAKSLLLESDGRIKEIFDEVGYSNQQYFSKVFKKITGVTVMEYKESRENRA